MLLSSPSFSGFLDTLATNPAAAQTAQAVQQPQQQVEQQQQQPPQRQRKDPNPYAAQQQMQHIGMTMIPEQAMDFSMLDLSNDNTFSYQPQVFSVLSMPETVIDTEVLSGKASFSSLKSDDEKVELPTVERMPVSETAKVELPVIDDEEFDADPSYALFASPAPTAIVTKPAQLDIDSLIRNISPKPSNYELIIVSEVSEAVSDAAMRRVERLAADMNACVERLAALTMHL